MVELDIYVLIWLLGYVWLMQRRIFFDLRFRLNVSEVLFWLFIFSISISAVILFENRKMTETKRQEMAERLGKQSDPYQRIVDEHLISATSIMTFLRPISPAFMTRTPTN